MQMSKRTMRNKSITQRVNEYLGTNYEGLITPKQWVDVSIYQNLSEDFIREFQDKVNWVGISAYQNLSEACEKLKIEEIRLVRTSTSTLSVVELSKDIHIAIMPIYVYDDEDRKKSAIEVNFTK